MRKGSYYINGERFRLMHTTVETVLVPFRDKHYDKTTADISTTKMTRLANTLESLFQKFKK